MKKLILTALIIGCFTTQCLAYTLSYTIPNPKAQRIKEAILYKYPNIETYDHDADEDTPKIAKYTDEEWVIEFFRRLIYRMWQRCEKDLIDGSTSYNDDQDASVTPTP